MLNDRFRLKNFMVPKYLYAKASEETELRLSEWLDKRGIRRTKSWSGEHLVGDFGFHITVAMSSNPVRIVNAESFMGAGIYVRPLEFSMFGSKKDIPVLKVDSGPLRVLREAYISQTNIQENSYLPWSPHISLSYDKDKITLPTEFPNFDLVFDKLIIENR